MRKRALMFVVPCFLVALALFRCGGGGDSSNAEFSQANLKGTWDIIQIATGSDAGWFRATATIDGSGNITAVDNLLDSQGNTDPGSLTVKWRIGSSGVVSEFDNNVDTGLHGVMSKDKKLVMAVQTLDNTTVPRTVVLLIARKRTGTAFSNADLDNVPFTYHQLSYGTDNTWQYGAGSTDASGQVTLTSATDPSGAVSPLPDFGTLSVNGLGIATSDSDSTFHGLMTDDKKVIFSISGDDTINRYTLRVITVTGQTTFTQADFAGKRHFIALRNTVNPLWSYGETSNDATGNNGTYLSYTDTQGGATPANFGRIISSTGVMTDNSTPVDATWHGQAAYNKNLTVRTNTNASGRHGISISIH